MRKAISNEDQKIHDWRYERKFIVSNLLNHEVETVIAHHPVMFSEIYNKRFVNNLYLDNLNMESYFENLEGLSSRSKVRIRWYGDLFGKVEKPVLEFKIKKGFLGTKISYSLDPFFMDEGFDFEEIKNNINRSEIPKLLKLKLNMLKPVLLNRYSRKYFQSNDKIFRVTVDTGLMVFRVKNFSNFFLHKTSEYTHIILELKYDENNDDMAEEVTRGFPFRMSKSSKYVDGVERLYSW